MRGHGMKVNGTLFPLYLACCFDCMTWQGHTSHDGGTIDPFLLKPHNHMYIHTLDIDSASDTYYFDAHLDIFMLKLLISSMFMSVMGMSWQSLYCWQATLLFRPLL